MADGINSAFKGLTL